MRKFIIVAIGGDVGDQGGSMFFEGAGEDVLRGAVDSVENADWVEIRLWRMMGERDLRGRGRCSAIDRRCCCGLCQVAVQQSIA